MLPVALTLVLGMVSAQAPPDRASAEQLARAGRAAEAIVIFKQLVARDPSDVESRLWVARLNLRLGRAAEAEDEFRTVLREHPADVDAAIGLASALLRRNAWADALDLLNGMAGRAADNGDYESTLARPIAGPVTTRAPSATRTPCRARSSRPCAWSRGCTSSSARACRSSPGDHVERRRHASRRVAERSRHRRGHTSYAVRSQPARDCALTAHLALSPNFAPRTAHFALSVAACVQQAPETLRAIAAIECLPY